MAKSTYSYAIKSIPTENDPDAILKQTITDIKANATAAGYRQVTGQLREMGLVVNHKKVLRLMRELNLLSTAYNKQTRKLTLTKERLELSLRIDLNDALWPIDRIKS